MKCSCIRWSLVKLCKTVCSCYKVPYHYGNDDSTLVSIWCELMGNLVNAGHTDPNAGRPAEPASLRHVFRGSVLLYHRLHYHLPS